MNPFDEVPTIGPWCAADRGTEPRQCATPHSRCLLPAFLLADKKPEKG